MTRSPSSLRPSTICVLSFLPRSGDRNVDILALMTEVNRHIETWIRARPGDWLWLHRRWPKDDA